MSNPIQETGRRTINRHPWTKEEDSYLINSWANTERREIVSVLARSIGQVYRRARQLGLKIDPAKTQFKKGQRPWNAGKKGQQRAWNTGKKGWQAGGRSPETQFKPGRTPNSWRPVGAERTTAGGILYRKVSDTGDKHKDWRAVHVMNYEAEYGPVPEGHFLIFKDGNRENRAADNLMPVTRAENMRRNTIGRYGTAYQSAAIQLGWLNRTIKRMEKDNAKPE